MDLTEEQQDQLWRLRAEWVGVYNILCGERWSARRIDHFSAGPEDWVSADTAEYPPTSPVRRANPWITLAIVLLFLFALIHVATNEAAKNSPPAACQLLGGTWNFWDGWHCY
jgi:hypothetical protein